MSSANRVPRVALVGRANVGKSSLFNALCGERKAIVEDYAGVTRDRLSALIAGEQLSYELLDTGGLFAEEEFQDEVSFSVDRAIEDSDLVVCVFDGIAGPHPLDQEIVTKLRRVGKPTLWVVNKTEKQDTQLAAPEFMSFGLDDLILTSAAHRQGTSELRRRIEERVSGIRGSSKMMSPAAASEQVRVAIVGKPNVGKSTLVNRLCGEERVIVSEIAGTTRDSIDVPLRREGREFLLIDTAGLRKKARIPKGSLERFSALRSLRALARADVALLLLDGAAEYLVSDQDKNIASLINEKGIPVLIVVNKWDAVEKDHKTSKKREAEIYEALPYLRYAPIVFISALSGQRCPSIFDHVLAIHDGLQDSVPTPELNRLLEKLFTAKPPPPSRGREIKFFYATQIKPRPPTFLLFCNYPKAISASYERYLKNGFRKELPFRGVEIKFVFRKRQSKDE